MPAYDEFFYIQNALDLLNNSVSEFSYMVGNPVYSLFLLINFLIFGVSFKIVLLTQLIISTLAGLLFFDTVKRLVNKQTALISFILYQFSGIIFMYDLLIGKFSLTLAVLIGAVHAYSLYSRKKENIPLLIYFISAWLILIFFRSMYSLFFIYLLFDLFGPQKVFLNRLLKITSIFIFIITIWFFSSSNHRSHLSYHLYMGFNKDSNGTFQARKYIRSFSQGHFEDADKISEFLKDKYSYPFINNFWMQKVISYWLNHPFKSVKLIIKKIIYVFEPDSFIRKLNHINLYTNPIRYILFPINYYIYSVLIIISFFAHYHGKLKLPLILIQLFIFQLLCIILTVVGSFYKAQFILVMSVFSGIAINFIVKNYKKINFKKFFFCLIVLFIYINLPRKEDQAFSYNIQRNYYNQNLKKKIKEKKIITVSYYQKLLYSENNELTSWKKLELMSLESESKYILLKAREKIYEYKDNINDIKNLALSYHENLIYDKALELYEEYLHKSGSSGQHDNKFNMVKRDYRNSRDKRIY